MRFSGLRKIPFVRIVIPFLVGDVAGLYLNRPFLWAGIVFLGGLLLYVYGFFRSDPALRYSREWAGGAGILAGFFAAGILAGGAAAHLAGEKKNFEGEAVVAATVFQPPVQKENSCRTEVILRGIRKENGWYRVHGRAVLYFDKNSRISTVHPGETILFHTRLRRFPFYGNPGEFDYRRYQSDHGIFWQAFVQEQAWRHLPGESLTSLMLQAKKAQNYLVDCLRKYGFSGSLLAVASALTAGERETMDADTKKYFADSGTMHILAISGLHVGILYFVALWLFSFFGKSPLVRIIRLLVILLLLWGYAFLTGLSPSVMRASLMFSLLLAGTSFRRKSNVYNILAVSAFVLLVVHPVWIRDAGFQLSYFAVLGIVTLYRPLYLPLATGIVWPDKIWALLVVSLAALAGTFPLTLYYFHRFPLYAPLINLLVIPLVTLFIYAGLAFFLLQPFPWLAALMAQVMKGLSQGLLFITQKSLTLPAAVISPVWITPAEVLLLYLLILSLILIFLFRKAAYILLLQGVVLAGVLLLLIRENDLAGKNRLVVFNIPRSSVCLLSSGRTGVITGDAGKKGTAYYLKDIRGALGLDRLVTACRRPFPEVCDTGGPATAGVYLHRGFFKTGTITGYLLNDSTMQHLERKTPVDILIFSGRKWWILEKQVATLQPALIILDPAVPGYAVRKIRKICSGRKLYVVREQGPFILEE